MIDLSPVVGLIIFIIGCFVLRPCIVFWRKQRQLRLQGITVEGELIDRHQERGTGGHPWYYLTYRYTCEGETFLCDQPVWLGDYERGDMLAPVCCLPTNPAVSSVFGDGFQSAEWVQRTIVGIIFFLAGMFIVIGSLLSLFAAWHP